MKFTSYSLSLLVALGITVSSTEAFTVARDTVKNGVSPLALEVATTTTKKKICKDALGWLRYWKTESQGLCRARCPPQGTNLYVPLFQEWFQCVDFG